MAYTLIHHTGCGSSKKGLALLEEKGVAVTVRKYMNAAERLTEAELRDIAKMMGAGPKAFMREKDVAAAGLDPEAISDDALFAAMADNPKLIQRPIGISNGKAVLGRPNEKLLEIV